MDLGFDNIKLVAGSLGAVVALVSGAFTLSDKFGITLWDRPVLEWSPDHFKIEDGYIEDGFKVIVARQKLRDDCEVVGFSVQIRDSDYLVYPAVTSVTKFSGPASDDVDMFGYRVFLREMDTHKFTIGEATLVGQIKYDCPEGQKIVTYPSHPNLTFNVLGVDVAEAE